MVVPGDGTSNSTAPSDTVLPDTTTTDSSDDTNLPWCDELPNNGETDSSTDDTSEVDDTGVDGTETDGTSTYIFCQIRASGLAFCFGGAKCLTQTKALSYLPR